MIGNKCLLQPFFICLFQIKIIFSDSYKINNLKLRLSVLDINNLLNKGYSLVYKGNKLIKDISSLSLDDEIIIKTGNGKIVARIIDLKKE